MVPSTLIELPRLHFLPRGYSVKFDSFDDFAKFAQLIDGGKIMAAALGRARTAPEHTYRKPARIAVQLSRPLEYAEAEFVRHKVAKLNKPSSGSLYFKLDDHNGHPIYSMMSLPMRIRLNQAGTRIYAESVTHESRPLYSNLERFLAENFINVYATAVRTFREAE